MSAIQDLAAAPCESPIAISRRVCWPTLPLDVWDEIARSLRAECGHSGLRSLAATCRALQALCRPHLYGRLTVTYNSLLRPPRANIHLFHEHATRLAVFNDQVDYFATSRLYRMSSAPLRELARATVALIAHLEKLAPRLRSLIASWFPPEGWLALQRCSGLRYLLVRGEGAPWRGVVLLSACSPSVSKLCAVECTLAAVAQCCAAAPVLRDLTLERVDTSGEQEALPSAVWRTIESVCIDQMGKQSIVKVFDSISRTPSLALRHLVLDASFLSLDDLHGIFDRLSIVPLTALVIQSAPFGGWSHGHRAHDLFRHLASRFPRLRQLTFARRKRHDSEPTVATLATYAAALTPCTCLDYLELDLAQDAQTPGDTTDAQLFVAAVPSLEKVVFQGKVSADAMWTRATYRIERQTGKMSVSFSGSEAK